MSIMTDTDIRALIERALTDRAALCRREARQRYMTGTRNAGLRAANREEAQRCDDLARRIGNTDPGVLAGAISGPVA